MAHAEEEESATSPYLGEEPETGESLMMRKDLVNANKKEEPCLGKYAKQEVSVASSLLTMVTLVI